MSGSGNRLTGSTARAVDAAVAAAQAAGRVPTLVAGVVRDGGLVHVARAGAPVDPDSQFRLGSITKTMTATLVLQLRDEGRLSLDDLLYRHLPGTAVGGVTLRQLLGHVSGLQREPDGPEGGWDLRGESWWERAPGVALDPLLAEVGPDKLVHPPYRSHHYSNLAYGLLGAVVQRITGERWAAIVDKRLRQPLGLNRTTYHPQEPYARGYVVHPWHGTLQEQPRHDSLAMAPAGQLWSTLADLGRWAAFLTDPDPAVLAPSTMAEMCAPVAIVDPDRWTAGHGLGLALRRHGERVHVGHTGSMPGYLAVVAVHRPSATGVVAFANAYTLRGTTIGQLGDELLGTVLDREPAPAPAWRPATAPAPAIAPLCGRWWWMGREYEVSAGADAEELVVTPVTVPGEASRFAPDGPDRWRGTAGPNDGELLLVRRGPGGRLGRGRGEPAGGSAGDDPGGTVTALEIATCRFTRDPVTGDPASPDCGELPPEHVR